MSVREHIEQHWAYCRENWRWPVYPLLDPGVSLDDDYRGRSVCLWIIEPKALDRFFVEHP